MGDGLQNFVVVSSLCVHCGPTRVQDVGKKILVRSKIVGGLINGAGRTRLDGVAVHFIHEANVQSYTPEKRGQFALRKFNVHWAAKSQRLLW